MTHPLFKKEIFVETAFARRFQKMLQDAWDNRAFHLLVADPGEGLTMSIRDLQKKGRWTIRSRGGGSQKQ